VVRELCIGKDFTFKAQPDVQLDGAGDRAYTVAWSLETAAARDREPPDRLSAREVEVLKLLAEGRSNQQIAADLSISLNTVARHVSHIFDKTGATNRTEAGAYAHRQGLV
jgi:DNA-binding NarL/FixJ family response regulator